MIDEAKNFAYKCHEGQVRKNSGLPYITHVERVANGVSEYTNNEDVISAAWLHDVCEDCDVDIHFIESKFNHNVANIVLCLTNASISSQHQGKPRAVRKRIDRDHLEYSAHVLHIKDEVHLVKSIDRRENLKDLVRENSSIKYKNLYSNESLDLIKILDKAPVDVVNEIKAICWRLQNG